MSLSKILNPKLLLMCGWHLAWWTCDELEFSALGSSKNPRDPIKGIKRVEMMAGKLIGRKYEARVDSCTIICLVKLLLVFGATYFNV